jgi:hypothetical protein
VVTGLDDHSRYCVIVSVVPRATARAVCTAFVQALRAFGCPQQVLSDNGKQFTGRFGKPRAAEVLFERICRKNGIETILTKPRSPTTTGKVKRFQQTLQADCFQAHGPFPDVAAAQAAVDMFRSEYNHARPHQALDDATPASRFVPVAEQVRAELGLDIPAELLNTLPADVSWAERVDPWLTSPMSTPISTRTLRTGAKGSSLVTSTGWAGRRSSSSGRSARAGTSRSGHNSSGSDPPTSDAGSGSGWTPPPCTCPWTECT